MASTDKKKVKITETSKQANVDIVSKTITLPVDSTDHTLVAKVPSSANCTSGVNVEVEMSPDGNNWCPALRKETVTTGGTSTTGVIGNEKYVDLQKNAPVYNSYAKGGLNFDVNGNEVALGTGARDLLDQHIAVNKSFNHSMWIKSDTLPDIARDETVTFTVTVLGGLFYINGVAQSSVYLKEGSTYTFDQAHSSNSGHPLRFSTADDGTHSGGTEYTTGVTTVGTPGSAGAYTKIVVAKDAVDLYYYCSNHSGMGGSAFTPVSKPYKPVLFRHGGYDTFENTKTVELSEGANASSTNTQALVIPNNNTNPDAGIVHHDSNYNESPFYVSTDSYPTQNFPDVGAGFGVSFWVKWTSKGTSTSWTFSNLFHYAFTDGSKFYLRNIHVGGQSAGFRLIRLQYTSGNYYTGVGFDGTSFTDGEWYHFTVAVKGTGTNGQVTPTTSNATNDMKLYVNGVEQTPTALAQSSTIPSFNSNTTKTMDFFRMNVRGTTSYSSSGDSYNFDNLAHYRGELNAATVASIYANRNKPLNASLPSGTVLTSLHRMGDGTGDVTGPNAADISIKNQISTNDFRLVGGTGGTPSFVTLSETDAPYNQTTTQNLVESRSTFTTQANKLAPPFTGGGGIIAQPNTPAATFYGSSGQVDNGNENDIGKHLIGIWNPHEDFSTSRWMFQNNTEVAGFRHRSSAVFFGYPDMNYRTSTYIRFNGGIEFSPFITYSATDAASKTLPVRALITGQSGSYWYVYNSNPVLEFTRRSDNTTFTVNPFTGYHVAITYTAPTDITQGIPEANLAMYVNGQRVKIITTTENNVEYAYGAAPADALFNGDEGFAANSNWGGAQYLDYSTNYSYNTVINNHMDFQGRVLSESDILKLYNDGKLLDFSDIQTSFPISLSNCVGAYDAEVPFTYQDQGVHIQGLEDCSGYGKRIQLVASSVSGCTSSLVSPTLSYNATPQNLLIGKFTTGSNLSISGWFKTTATGTLFSNRDSSQGLKVEVTTSGITVTHNSTTVNFNNGGPFNDGEWHHFCLRRFANNIYQIFIDYLGAGTTYQLAQADTDWQGSNGFTLLSDGDNNAHATSPSGTDASKLNASLSNWSIHGEALSDAAIKQIYSNGHVRNIKNLPDVNVAHIAAWWQLADTTNPQNDLVGSNHLQLVDKGVAKDKALKTVGDGTNPTANSFEITGTNKNLWAEASSDTVLSLDPDTSNNAQGGLGVTMQIKCEAGVTASSDFSRKNLLCVKLTNGKLMEMFLEKNTSSNELIFVLFMSDTVAVSSSNSSGTIATFSAGTGLDDGNWHHLSVNITDDSSDLSQATRIYLDGSLVTQGNHPWNGYTHQSFTGTVDEVVVLGNAGAHSSGNNLNMDVTIDNLGFFTGYYHNNHFTSTAAAVLYNNRNDLSNAILDASFSSDQPAITALFEMGDRNGDVISPNSAISLKDKILPTYRAITPQSSLHANSGVVTLSSTEDPYLSTGGATNTDLSTKLVDATGATLVEKSINGNALTLSITKNFNFTTESWVSDASGDAALCLSLNGFEEQAEYFALWKCSQTLPDGAVDVCDGNWHNIALSYRGQNDLSGDNVAEGDAVRFGRGSSDNPFNFSLAIDGYPVYTEIGNNTGADYIGGNNTLITDTISNVTYNVGFNIYNRHLKYNPNNTEEEYRVHGQFGSGVHTYLPNETDPHSFRGEVDETSFHTDPWWSNADGTNIDVFGSDTSKRGNLFNKEKTYTLYGRTTALANRGANARYPIGVPYPLLNPELLVNSGNIADIEGTNQFLNPVRKGDTQSWNSQASAGGLEGWWRWGDTPGDCSITVNDVKDHSTNPAVDYRDIDAVYLTDQGTSSNVVLATNESIYLASQASSSTPGTSATQFNQIKLENLSSLVGSAACTVKDFVSPVLQYLRIKLTGTGTCDIGEGKLEIEVNYKKRRMK